MALIRYRRNRALPVAPWFGGWAPQDPFGDDFFRRFFGEATVADRPIVRRPAVDVSENDDGFEVTAELAGFSGDDVTVEVDDGVLTFRAERSEEREDEDGNVVMSERHQGTFQRSFRLPENVDSDAITADMKDGVLTLTVPKVEVVEPKPKQIEVHVS
jgi:HSP20 family protein